MSATVPPRDSSRFLLLLNPTTRHHRRASAAPCNQLLAGLPTGTELPMAKHTPTSRLGTAHEYQAFFRCGQRSSATCSPWSRRRRIPARLHLSAMPYRPLQDLSLIHISEP